MNALEALVGVAVVGAALAGVHQMTSAQIEADNARAFADEVDSLRAAVILSQRDALHDPVRGWFPSTGADACTTANVGDGASTDANGRDEGCLLTGPRVNRIASFMPEVFEWPVPAEGSFGRNPVSGDDWELRLHRACDGDDCGIAHLKIVTTVTGPQQAGRVLRYLEGRVVELNPVLAANDPEDQDYTVRVWAHESQGRLLAETMRSQGSDFRYHDAWWTETVAADTTATPPTPAQGTCERNGVVVDADEDGTDDVMEQGECRGFVDLTRDVDHSLSADNFADELYVTENMIGSVPCTVGSKKTMPADDPDDATVFNCVSTVEHRWDPEPAAGATMPTCSNKATHTHTDSAGDATKHTCIASRWELDESGDAWALSPGGDCSAGSLIVGKNGELISCRKDGDGDGHWATATSYDADGDGVPDWEEEFGAALGGTESPLQCGAGYSPNATGDQCVCAIASDRQTDGSCMTSPKAMTAHTGKGHFMGCPNGQGVIEVDSDGKIVGDGVKCLRQTSCPDYPELGAYFFEEDYFGAGKVCMAADHPAFVPFFAYRRDNYGTAGVDRAGDYYYTTHRHKVESGKLVSTPLDWKVFLHCPNPAAPFLAYVNGRTIVNESDGRVIRREPPHFSTKQGSYYNRGRGRVTPEDRYFWRCLPTKHLPMIGPRNHIGSRRSVYLSVDRRMQGEFEERTITDHDAYWQAIGYRPNTFDGVLNCDWSPVNNSDPLRGIPATQLMRGGVKSPGWCMAHMPAGSLLTAYSHRNDSRPIKTGVFTVGECRPMIDGRTYLGGKECAAPHVFNERAPIPNGFGVTFPSNMRGVGGKLVEFKNVYGTSWRDRHFDVATAPYGTVRKVGLGIEQRSYDRIGLNPNWGTGCDLANNTANGGRTCPGVVETPMPGARGVCRRTYSQTEWEQVTETSGRWKTIEGPYWNYHIRGGTMDDVDCVTTRGSDPGWFPAIPDKYNTIGDAQWAIQRGDDTLGIPTTHHANGWFKYDVLYPYQKATVYAFIGMILSGRFEVDDPDRPSYAMYETFERGMELGDQTAIPLTSSISYDSVGCDEGFPSRDNVRCVDSRNHCVSTGAEADWTTEVGDVLYNQREEPSRICTPLRDANGNLNHLQSAVDVCYDREPHDTDAEMAAAEVKCDALRERTAVGATGDHAQSEHGAVFVWSDPPSP